MFRSAYFRPTGSKRTASRFASLTLRTAPRAGKARPGFRMAYFRPAGSKRACSRSAKADPPNCAPRGRGPPGVPAGLLALGPNARPSGPLKRTLRTAPRAGVARPGFRPAYWPVGPNARPPGSLRSPSELRPVRARPARGSAWLIFALRAQNAHAPGPLKRTLRTAPRAGVARPGFRMAYFRPAGSKRACSRFAPGGRGFLSGADVENRPKRGILKLM